MTKDEKCEEGTCPGTWAGPIACNDCENSPMIGKDIKFEKTRRITGYLAPLEKWNNAKKAEEKARVKHV